MTAIAAPITTEMSMSGLKYAAPDFPLEEVGFCEESDDLLEEPDEPLEESDELLELPVAVEEPDLEAREVELGLEHL